jgi:hypothetical protein
MELSTERFLEEVTRDEPEVRMVAALSTTHPEIAPYLVTPFPATCHQGACEYTVIVLSERGDAVLYADSQTHRFGIAFRSAARHGHVFAGLEYPSIDLAVLMFLGDPSVLDPAP